PESKPEVKPEIDKDYSFKFPFYSFEIGINDDDLNIPMDGKLKEQRDFAIQWRNFKKQEAKKIIPELNRIAKTYGLNDYLKFEMLDAYVDNRYPDADASKRTALKHYLLANMGYDVRLGLINKSPGLLVNFKQFVYGRLATIDTATKVKYYIFMPDNGIATPSDEIYTCQLPSGADLGQPVDLLLTELNLPPRMKDFNFSFGGIELKGQINENIFPMIYRYPQMDMTDYATSSISPGLREDLVRQLKAQLKDMPKEEAVDKLLHFTQKAFKYETDGVLHGFEKPYFIEEMLYYPACDCEDRSIFYTYMLWNVLGVENHLLNYPGHESAAVHLSTPINGAGYDYEGKRFYISDPTYMGASTGMCMDRYEKTKPTIDHIYK
ncbi:MAG: hypothetical protein K2K84_05820, partial [Muribaculaceae bacterium]|nr:hypothetical protein [Muribaculaceae bacterium]